MNKILMRQRIENAQKEIDSKKMIVQNGKMRQHYHFMPQSGWMNDPNGLIFFNGQYHVFYQTNPYNGFWDCMHWGHAVSKDLVHWEYLPLALAPSEEYDDYQKGGCFSGSAIEHEGKLYVFYTATANHGNGSEQSQCLAISEDGINFEKYDGNPLFDAPEGIQPDSFRDPKVWKHENKYYMVVGASRNNRGLALIYESADLYHWNFLNVLAESRGEWGFMWECPDFYHLEEKYVLMVSPQEMEAKEREFHSGNNSVFLIGTYCKCNYKFNREKIQNVDYGLDFYAPQTMQTEDGRRILIGWMQSWDNPIYQDIHAWSGMMTIPRELTIKEGHVCQWPVRELEKYRTGKVSYESVVVGKELSLADIEGRSIDMEIQLTGDTYQKYRMKLAAGDSRYSEIIYNRKEKVLTFDRTYSGLKRDATSMRSMYVEEENGMLSLRVLVDRYSVEIFVNNGEQVMTSLIYTPLSENSISFSCEGEACMNITKYNIEV